tara:strand:+ start:76 stop:249 length:174 start_codon:yes stop_codon:yes gene_type:complete
MRYKEQIQGKAEAVTNILETLERGLQANAISKVEAVKLVGKLKRLVSDINSFADLEG